MLGLDDPYSAGAVEADWWAPPLGRPETLREVATHLKQGRTPYGQKSARGGRWQRAFAVKWLSQYKGFVAGWVCDAFGRLDVFKSRALYANPVAQALEPVQQNGTINVETTQMTIRKRFTQSPLSGGGD